jgi:hypothetical protein
VLPTLFRGRRKWCIHLSLAVSRAADGANGSRRCPHRRPLIGPQPVMLGVVLSSPLDYDMRDQFVDADPEISQAHMREMGISFDYFLAVAPDPTDDQQDQIRRTLQRITGRPEPK